MYRFFSSGLPDHERDDDLHPFETEVANYTYNITINPDNNGKYEQGIYIVKC